MPLDASGTEVRHDGAIGTDRPNDVALSPDGAYIYVAGDDGNLRIYSADTGELLRTIDVGTSLGGIDVSPDGSFLMAVELVPLEEHYAGSWPDNEFVVTVYKVDLATGEVTSYPYTATGYDYNFFDVAVLANGDVLLSQSILPGWSGWVSMKLLDLATGTYAVAYDGIRHSSTISVAEDGSYVLVGENDNSDAGLLVYQSGVGIVATHNWYEDDVSGFNRGVQAISSEAGLVAQSVYGNGLHIYDLGLNYQLNLTDIYPEWTYGTVSALAFSSDGKYLFVLDNAADAIVQLSTSNWNVVATIPVDADLSSWTGDFGNRLLVGTDMRYFTVVTEDGFLQVDNPNMSSTINGTSASESISGTGLFDEINGLAGADQISAGAGNDIIDGGGGNDQLFGEDGDDVLLGGTGNDLLDGGAGIDTASYETAASRVVVSLAISGAQGTLGAGSDTLVGIENLTGSSYNDRLTGNTAANVLVGLAGNDVLLGGAGDDTLDGGDGDDVLYGGAGTDTLLGGAGNDRLDGRAGDDAMSGGAGNDVYYVDSLGDTATENAGEGTDTVRSTVSFTLADNVENLRLAGTASLGTGNELANVITGSAGANVLSGLAGDDILRGGAGADTLLGGDGDDRLFGGTGDDLLDGGAGRDVFYGNGGADTFVFRDGDFAGLTRTTCDSINDFSQLQGDKLAFDQVDANTLVAGLQAFQFIGTAAFSNVAGELRYEIVGGHTYVYGDTDGNGVADFMVRVIGSHSLTESDFLI